MYYNCLYAFSFKWFRILIISLTVISGLRAESLPQVQRSWDFRRKLWRWTSCRSGSDHWGLWCLSQGWWQRWGMMISTALCGMQLTLNASWTVNKQFLNAYIPVSVSLYRCGECDEQHRVSAVDPGDRQAGGSHRKSLWEAGEVPWGRETLPQDAAVRDFFFC